LFFFAVTKIGTAATPSIDVSSDGSDGDLIVMDADVALVDDPLLNGRKLLEVDLAQAVRGVWSDDNQGDDNQGVDIGRGVYDADKWAVTFEYGSVHIGPNVRVAFKNHPSYCPVVWLVNGNCRIDGVLDVSGKPTTLSDRGTGEPGPGGLRGGYGLGGSGRFQWSGGLGPGGGAWQTPGRENDLRGGSGGFTFTDQSNTAALRQ
jgi:hypothetical protein